jgi:hypothetical protein
MARAEIDARGAPTAAAAPTRRRRRSTGRRRVTKKPALIRRLGRVVWVSPGHAGLALTTGLVCGALASRIGGPISPPYAAILGALIGYPALVAIWRRLPRAGGRR